MSTDFTIWPQDISEMLPLVRRPSRYIGLEVNRAAKNWDAARFRILLAFPDLYEIGMSHQGLHILYRIINERDDLLADRVYVPDVDMEALLREKKVSLFGLESRRPVKAFDILGITLPYELCYSNILTMLDLAGIAFLAGNRRESDPLVVGGGSAVGNPEPVADFFDAIVIGDGEEAVLELADMVRELRGRGEARASILQALTTIPGVYVPSLYQPVYDAGGALKSIQALSNVPQRVRRRVLPRLAEAKRLCPPLMPLSHIVHDRLGIEIARGCTRGCRFCQAGTYYRPVRERDCSEILAAAQNGIAQTGFEEMALLSLSTGDFSCLPQLLTELMDSMGNKQVAVSLPSMRVGTLTPEIMRRICQVRKTGFTLAPEAGSERLRQVINKGITEQDLLDACSAAFGLGWRLLKLYFMFGLPMEIEEDISAISRLARLCLDQAGPAQKKCRLNISVATFVPKPHTPFQWAPQISVQQGFDHIDRLKKQLKPMRAQLKWHDPRQSFLEGVFSRGDRRLSPVLQTAWRMGARLDGWSEHFHLDLWRAAAATEGVDLDRYLRARDINEPLPWDHLHMGVDRTFLLAELHKAETREPTPDCRYHGCQKCGLCDFKTIQPVVGKKKVTNHRGSLESERCPETSGLRATPFPCRFHYSRTGDIRFLGHLEVIQLVYRALRRTGLPLLFSQGFSPIPRVAFSPALSVGVESRAEWFDAFFAAPPGEPQALMAQVNLGLPQGLQVTGLEPFPAPAPLVCVIDYTVFLPCGVVGLEQQKERLAAFLAADSFVISKKRKGQEKKIDIRQQVRSFTAGADNTLHLRLETVQSRGGAKPLELVAAVFAISTNELSAARVVKTAWHHEK